MKKILAGGFLSLIGTLWAIAWAPMCRETW